jgi:hypothetical protein
MFFREAMEQKHAERQSGRHQQLNMRGVGKQERRKGETNRRYRRRTAVARQQVHQVEHANRGEDKADQNGRIVRRERVPGGPVTRNRQYPRANVAIGIRQRALVRMKDVGVEHVNRIDDQRPRHPRHVPNR